MKKKLLVTSLMLLASATFACDLMVDNVRANPSMPGMDNSAAYFNITNSSKEDFVLTGVTSDVADFTELHTMSMKDDKMIMRKIDSVKIPAGESVDFRGHYHVMLIGLKSALKEGMQFDLNLMLKNGKIKTVRVPVAFKTKNSEHNHEEEHKH